MSHNFVKKRSAHILGETYGLFPLDNIRFEMEDNKTGNDWGFFANKSNRTLIHIKFKSELLESGE